MVTRQNLARASLSRNATAQEVVHTAAAIVSGDVEVGVFDEGRIYVAATSASSGVLMPRTTTSAESEMLARFERNESASTVVDDGVIATPITDNTGALVATLTAFTDGTPPIDALHGLARILAAEIGETETEPAGFYEAVLQGARDTVVVIKSDLTISWSSKSSTSLLGRSPQALTGTSAADLIHPDDITSALDAIVRISQGLEVTRVRLRAQHASGSYIPIEVTGIDHSTDPTVDGIVLSLRDGQYDGELEAKIDVAQRFSQALIESLSDGIVATDRFGTVIVANDIARSIFGIDEESIISELSLHDFTLVNAEGQPLQPLSERTETEEVCPVVTTDGELVYVTPTQHNVSDDDGNVMGLVTVFHDVTTVQNAADELRTQALHDQLTGLANRRQLEQRILELVRNTDQVHVAACFIDLDNFKLINDNHGHRTGDQVVRMAAQRLTEQLGDRDLLVRQGGDEFVALLVDVEDLQAAHKIAERCRIALDVPYEVDEDRFDVTTSIGVAIAEPGELVGDQLLQHADIALYAAKNRGRNRVELFDTALADAVKNEDRQRRILREALDDGRLVMHFQPLVITSSEITSGYEALARIRTREGDLIGPGQFMEAIANTSLMWDLDRAAFALSCQAAEMLARISPEDPPHIACNFSSVSLTHPMLAQFLQDTVQAAGVDPSQITIEITESAAFDAGVDSLKTLTELHQIGFSLALDDFGTGYSSLAHLRDLPISTVKVDRSFINKLGNNDSERAIAEAVVSLAKDLKLSVVAEGVETVEHLSHVRDLGFGVIQGWHYAPALSLADCLQDWTQASDATAELPPTD